MSHFDTAPISVCSHFFESGLTPLTIPVLTVVGRRDGNVVCEHRWKQSSIGFRPALREHHIVMRRRAQAVGIGALLRGVPELEETDGAVAAQLAHKPRRAGTRPRAEHGTAMHRRYAGLVRVLRHSVAGGQQFLDLLLA